jgi:hypothetical protein
MARLAGRDAGHDGDDFAGWRITRNLGLCITELFAYGTGVVVETAS